MNLPEDNGDSSIKSLVHQTINQDQEGERNESSSQTQGMQAKLVQLMSHNHYTHKNAPSASSGRASTRNM
jgi:hypothetical protein